MSEEQYSLGFNTQKILELCHEYLPIGLLVPREQFNQQFPQAIEAIAHTRAFFADLLHIKKPTIPSVDIELWQEPPFPRKNDFKLERGPNFVSELRPGRFLFVQLFSHASVFENLLVLLLIDPKLNINDLAYTVNAYLINETYTLPRESLQEGLWCSYFLQTAGLNPNDFLPGTREYYGYFSLLGPSPEPAQILSMLPAIESLKWVQLSQWVSTRLRKYAKGTKYGVYAKKDLA